MAGQQKTYIDPDYLSEHQRWLWDLMAKAEEMGFAVRSLEPQKVVLFPRDDHSTTVTLEGVFVSARLLEGFVVARPERRS